MAAIEPCNCMSEVDAMLKDRNTRLQHQFVVSGLRAGLTPRMRCLPIIATERIASGRGTKKPLTVAPTFCPFCGLKYPTHEAAEAPDEPEPA